MGKEVKPTDAEILQGMLDQFNGYRCVTYALRNRLGRKRCTTAWLRSQLRRMVEDGRVALSTRQDRADMIQFDITDTGRCFLEALNG
jgi:DNA-binding HxlR family transcriptional regulator